VRLILSTFFAATGFLSAHAEPLTIDLQDAEPASRETVTYACGDDDVVAEYINVGNNSLAIVQLGSGPVIMANVMSGSGAKYVGQQFEWWSKGDEASLVDLMQGPDAPPVICKSKR
jgi:membrane-bound inhibitor of C-type lysozyme